MNENNSRECEKCKNEEQLQQAIKKPWKPERQDVNRRYSCMEMVMKCGDVSCIMYVKRWGILMVPKAPPFPSRLTHFLVALTVRIFIRYGQTSIMNFNHWRNCILELSDPRFSDSDAQRYGQYVSLYNIRKSYSRDKKADTRNISLEMILMELMVRR